MKMSNIAKNTKGSSTLKITARAKELKASGLDIVPLTAGEPDFYTPEHIKQGGIDAINNNCTTYTPSGGIIELKNAICKKLKNDNNLDYNANQIVVSNGAKHSLINSLMAILDKGDEVIIPTPFWLSYSSMLEIAGGVPVFANTLASNDYIVTKEELERVVTPKSVAIMLNSPNNPTGAVYTLEQLKVVADFAIENDLIVISDEIYENLVYDEDFKHISIATIDGMKDRCIVINGVSKSYAMTGWRMGYLAAPADIAGAITNIQSHMTSNASYITQMAALTAITGSYECVDIMKKAFKERRDYIYKRIIDIDKLHTVKPKGAFYIFVDISDLCGLYYKEMKITSCNEVTDILLNEFGVSVIPCEDFGDLKAIRLSFATSMDNIVKGLDRIEAFVEQLLVK